MAVNIILTVAGQGSGSGGESREFTYSIVNPTAPLVTLTIDDVTGVTSYLWEILNQPLGAATSLSSSTNPAPTFTPTDSIWGTYLIRCTIIRNTVQEIGTVALSFKTPNKDMRFPAAGEKTEFSLVNGWMEAEHVLYEIVDNLVSGGTGYWDRTGTILSPLNAGDTLQLSDGSASIPSSAYVTDPDTGRYLVSTGVEAFSAGGSAQLLFGNDGNPYIKAADGHEYLKIGNYKTTAGTASKVLVEAAGAAANPGGSLYLRSTAPSTKTTLIDIKSLSTSGQASVSMESDSGSSAGSSSTATVWAHGQGPSVVNIKTNTTVNSVDSIINILSTSAFGDSEINLSADGGGIGVINLGSITTDSIRIIDKNLDDSSVPWSYLEVSSTPAEWDTLNTNFSGASLVAILNSLYASSGVTVSSGVGINIVPTGLDREINVHDAPATEIDFDAVNGSAYKPLQKYFSFIQGPCKIATAEGLASDGGSGTLDVAAGNGIAKSSNSQNANTVFFQWASSTGLSLTDNDVSYVFAVYDAVTPYVLISTNAALTNRLDYILLAIVKREGTDIDIRNLDACSDVVWRLNRKSSIQNNYGPEYGNGIIIGDAGARKISITAGTIFFGIADSTTSAFDSSGADTFSTFYTTDSGTTWVKTDSQTTLSNTQYNDISSGLASIGVGKWGVHWIYYDYSGDHCYSLYGVESYNTLTDAEESLEPPNKPWQITEWSFLIGRVIVQQGTTESVDVTSIFIDEIAGGTSISIHNNLSGLQGGTAGEYYHLSSADYTDLTNNLPITNNAIVFGNSDGELDFNATTFHWVDSLESLQINKTNSTANWYSSGGAVFDLGGTATQGVVIFSSDYFTVGTRPQLGAANLDLLSDSTDSTSDINVIASSDSTTDNVNVHIESKIVDGSGTANSRIEAKEYLTGDSAYLNLKTIAGSGSTVDLKSVPTDSTDDATINIEANVFNASAGYGSVYSKAYRTANQYVQFNEYVNPSQTSFSLTATDTDDAGPAYVDIDARAGSTSNALSTFRSRVNGSGTARITIEAIEDLYNSSAYLTLQTNNGTAVSASLISDAINDGDDAVLYLRADTDESTGGQSAIYIQSQSTVQGDIFLEANGSESAGQIYIHDQAMVGSTVTSPVNIGGASIAQWTTYTTNFGATSSYVNAFNSLYAAISGGGVPIPAGRIPYGNAGGTGLAHEAALVYNETNNTLDIYDTSDTNFIRISHDGTNGRINISGNCLALGAQTTSHSLNGDGDIIVNKLEANSVAYFDQSIFANDNVPIYFGASDDAVWRWDAAYQTNDALTLGLSGSFNFIIGNKAYIENDFDLPDSTYPTLFLFSEEDPDTANNEYGYMQHNGTAFYISSGTHYIDINSRLADASSDAHVNITSSASNNNFAYIQLYANADSGGTAGDGAQIDINVDGGDGDGIIKFTCTSTSGLGYIDVNENQFRDIGAAGYTLYTITVTSNDFDVQPDNGITQKVSISADATASAEVPTGGSTRTTVVVSNTDSSSHTVTFGGTSPYRIYQVIENDITTAVTTTVEVTCAAQSDTVITLIYRDTVSTLPIWYITASPCISVNTTPA